MDRFDNVRVFAKVVESGSFAGAAAQLSISASMVSHHVKGLEERLGARLLNRTTRKISVTEVGRAYYERCTRVLADLEEADRAAGDMQTTPRGNLRVNATTYFGASCLGPVIADFIARFPDVSVELTLSGRVGDLVDEGFDVAVRLEPLPDSSLIARRLAVYRVVICGAPSYFEKRGMPCKPADLSDHNCLVFTGSSFYRRWHLIDGNTDLRFPPAGNVSSNHPSALLHAALAGHGLMYAPTYVVGEALQSGQLVSVLDDFVPPVTVRALYPHSRHLSTKVRTFVDFLAARFGPEPPFESLGASSPPLKAIHL
jgi:DNA-binding transcriptional LysR family regulator